ncbi:MAG: hypothetical protein PVS3B3_23730 [Ktedonobacteraceae bacterium]
MDHTVIRQKGFPGRLGTLLCIWFLAGMPLSMLLSGVYAAVGVPLPSLFFFLSSIVYLTGGLLGGMWGKERLHRKGLLNADGIVTLFILIVSIGFLLLSIVFLAIGFQRL